MPERQVANAIKVWQAFHLSQLTQLPVLKLRMTQAEQLWSSWGPDHMGLLRQASGH